MSWHQALGAGPQGGLSVSFAASAHPAAWGRPRPPADDSACQCLLSPSRWQAGHRSGRPQAEDSARPGHSLGKHLPARERGPGGGHSLPVGGIQCQGLWSPGLTHKKPIPRAIVTNEATEAQGGGLTGPKPCGLSQGARQGQDPASASRGTCPLAALLSPPALGCDSRWAPQAGQGLIPPHPCPHLLTPTPLINLIWREEALPAAGSGPDTPSGSVLAPDRGNGPQAAPDTGPRPSVHGRLGRKWDPGLSGCRSRISSGGPLALACPLISAFLWRGQSPRHGHSMQLTHSFILSLNHSFSHPCKSTNRVPSLHWAWGTEKAKPASTARRPDRLLREAPAILQGDSGMGADALRRPCFCPWPDPALLPLPAPHKPSTAPVMPSRTAS